MDRCAPIVLCGALTALSGCAKIGLGEPHVVSERTVSTDVTNEPHVGSPSARAQQSGTTLSVHVGASCLADEVAYPYVERVTERERQNTTPQNDLYAGIAGASLAAFGVVMMATPETFASSNQSSTSSLSSKEAFGTGVGLAVMGAVLLAAPVIDAIRASGSERSTAVTRGPGEVRRRGVPCAEQARAGAPIVASIDGGRALRLGDTDASGNLTIDLVAAIPRDALISPCTAQWCEPPRATRTSLLADGKPFAEIDLAPALAHYEDEAWRKLDPEACATRPAADTCAAIATFVRRFPNGPHASAATTSLEKYSTILEEERNKAAAEEEKRAKEDAAREAKRVAVERAREEAEARRQQAAAAARERTEECTAKCATACGGDGSCTRECVSRKCR